ncbi:MAG: hypothetical protein ACXVIS_07125 [Halobacteriota archaeon]
MKTAYGVEPLLDISTLRNRLYQLDVPVSPIQQVTPAGVLLSFRFF